MSHAVYPNVRAALFEWVNAAQKAMDDVVDAQGTDEPWQLIGKQRDAVYDIPSWTTVVKEIKGHPYLGQQLDAHVGTALWTMRVEASTIGDAFFYGLLYRSSAPDLSRSEEFEQIYLEVETFLAAEQLEYDTTVFLYGLQCDETPIKLDERTSIDLIPQDDIAALGLGSTLIDIAYDQVRGGSVGDLNIPSHYRHALRKRICLPKIIGPVPPEAASLRVATYEQLLRDVNDCMAAIVATQVSWLIPSRVRVRECGLRSRSGEISLPGTHMLSRFDAPGGRISSTDVPLLHRVWTHLKHPNFRKKNGAIVVALMRLAGIGARQTYEDQLVDIMIGFEAFFLPKRSETELNFRLALNAAYLLKKIYPETLAEQHFWFIKKAYGFRGSIVHGTQPGEIKYRSIDGSIIGPAAYIQYTANVLRICVAWAIENWNPGDEIVIDWENDLYFSRI